ncbi:MADS-box transcription factor 6 isoform X2 [Dendrobium catenatum]|uniref:MADS-box transcription factor 6 isoform X2 n=1 Tax=Dendrobium catenatum TaxID=906689 RepID=UPI00109F82B1|nr:MADS-box transcription factor 6 isoform X2 [Dendrobium catenatum]
MGEEVESMGNAGFGRRRRGEGNYVGLLEVDERISGESRAKGKRKEAKEDVSSFFAKWFMELSKLKAKYESLQQSQRHLLGEDLDALTLKDLEHLEQQLESALSLGRQRRTEIMLNQMEELKKKLAAEYKPMRSIHRSWRPDAVVATGALPDHPTHPIVMDTEPTLQIGYPHYESSEATIPRNVGAQNNFMQGWTL